MKALLQKLFTVEYTKKSIDPRDTKLATRVLFLNRWLVALFVFDYQTGKWDKIKPED